MRCTRVVRGNRCANRATVDDRCAAHAPAARLAALQAAVVAAALVYWRNDYNSIEDEEKFHNACNELDAALRAASPPPGEG